MVERVGEVKNYERSVMNYYGINDTDFENGQTVRVNDDGQVEIFSQDGDMIETR